MPAIRDSRRSALLAGAVLAAIVLTTAACSLIPAASLSPRELALQQVAANQALWNQKGPQDYAITIEEQCFCPSAQYEIVVNGGIVTKVTRDGAPVAPAEVARLPKTVPELFAVIPALPPDAGVTVTFDRELGYPTNIQVDPIPNAIDDEYAIVVHTFQFL